MIRGLENVKDEELKEKIIKEGDEKKWIHCGLKCEITRCPRSLHLCGYVTVPFEHPAVDYFENGKKSNYGEWHNTGYDAVTVDVHGGLTYGMLKEGELKLGFDCAHLGDTSPGYERFASNDTYKDMLFVTKEVESLAEQLYSMGPRPDSMEPIPKKITAWAVVGDDGKIISYLDKSLGDELEKSKQYHERKGYKIIEMTGELT